MTREEATAFIGKNASFYLEKWKIHSETMLKGWNWAAMFFGIEWMAYRKMYLEALLSFCILSAVGILFDPDGKLWGYGLRILIGVFGNALYRNKALRILRTMNMQNDSARLHMLSRRGGASILSVVVILFLEILYVCFVFYYSR